jgi:hypothetical protein
MMSKALKPAFLVNNGGGVIPWEAWLKRPTMEGFDLSTMVFSDGNAVNDKREAGTVRGDFWTEWGRDEMRDFAGVSRPIGWKRQHG